MPCCYSFCVQLKDKRKAGAFASAFIFDDIFRLADQRVFHKYRLISITSRYLACFSLSHIPHMSIEILEVFLQVLFV